jgi:hypothetical protein
VTIKKSDDFEVAGDATEAVSSLREADDLVLLFVYAGFHADAPTIRISHVG